MDNNLLTFCLLALWAASDGLFSQKKVWIKMTLSGIFIYLGLMTKGPVALYPVAAPFLFSLAFEKEKWIRGLFRSAWIGFVAAGLFVVMLALIPEARTYFEMYWEKRLGVVIAGTREDATMTGWARLFIFVILAKELAGLAILTFLSFFISQKLKQGSEAHSSNQFILKISLLFLFLGISSTLPLIASARQSGMYIISGLPMFALAAGYYCLPLLQYWLEKPGAKTAVFLKNLRMLSIAGMFVLAAYTLFLFGKPGREKALLHDLPAIQKTIPKAEKVAVCDAVMNDFHAHTYLQRFHHLELTRDFAASRYALTERRCDAALQEILLQHGFQKVEIEQVSTEHYFIYLKK